jgi:hypothetical protein
MYNCVRHLTRHENEEMRDDDVLPAIFFGGDF